MIDFYLFYRYSHHDYKDSRSYIASWQLHPLLTEQFKEFPNLKLGRNLYPRLDYDSYIYNYMTHRQYRQLIKKEYRIQEIKQQILQSMKDTKDESYDDETIRWQAEQFISVLKTIRWMGYQKQT